MNSKAYWNKRFEAIKLDGIKRADATVKDVQEVYAYALQRLQADVEQWYHRYALENHLSLADARKQLDARELKAFRLTLKEYQDMAQQEGLSDEHIRMLENASIRVRLDRAQQLYIQLAHHTARLANELDEDTKQVLADTYESSTYKTAFETQRMQGVFKDVPLLSEDSIQKAIAKPWTSDGKIFSDRIWENREQLVSTLQTEITRSLIIGEGTGKLSERIAKRFDVSYHRARALIETETAHIQEEASYEQYKAHNLEQYEILATLDTKTSAICQSMDGKIIDMKDYKPGITAPPFHPYCRTTKIPYIKGITDDIEDTRAYRDENGKTQFTDSALHYDEWYNKYVNNVKEKSILKEPVESDDRPYNRLIQYAKESNVDYKPVSVLKSPHEEDKIISILSGGDETKGACASVALAYIGQKQGFDVLDFRGGESQKFFSRLFATARISEMTGVVTKVVTDKKEMLAGLSAFSQIESGKEYYLAVGSHASIVKRTVEGELHYLELQSDKDSGWKKIESERFVLSNRFGASNRVAKFAGRPVDAVAYLIDIEASNFNTDEFQSILGFLNTNKDEEMKGVSGYAK